MVFNQLSYNSWRVVAGTGGAPAGGGGQIYNPVGQARPHNCFQDRVGDAHDGGRHHIRECAVEHVVSLQSGHQQWSIFMTDATRTDLS